MRYFGALVRFLAVFMSAGVVLLRLVVLATLVMVRRFAVMVSRRPHALPRQGDDVGSIRAWFSLALEIPP